MQDILLTLCDQIQQAILLEDGATLSRVLSREDSATCQLIINNSQNFDSNLSQFRILLPKGWFEIFEAHCRSIITSQLDQQFFYQSKVLKEFSDKIYNDSLPWVLPVMAVLTNDFRRLALHLYGIGGINEQQLKNSYTSVLQPIFTQTMNCRDGKRDGALFVVNNMLRILKKLNSHVLLETIIKKMEHAKMLERIKLTHGKAHLVTFHFFLGYLKFFEGNYRVALESLKYAFENCPARFSKNKRLILLYLIPIKLLQNIRPSSTLLKKYNLLIFEELSRSVSRGNVGRFENVLRSHENFFVKRGLYVVLERLKLRVYRNLFKRMHEFLEGVNKIPIEKFQIALRVAKLAIDKDECECIVANLIYQKMLKGYISHSQATVVFSKQEPFPLLLT
ncbi:PCI domain-containing protein 2-like [Zophobas morio]|jgi:hypothetical protein|uniref:PCI domain-containing protein 2-like n=1 Tax=Zophobas morio TaxID=2755281 RepID=UPI003082CD9F